MSEPAVEEPLGRGSSQQDYPRPQCLPGIIFHEILVVAYVE
jgi:hypothetical protein